MESLFPIERAAVSYLGLVLLCGAFTAIGILCALMSKNQSTAFLSSVLINFLFFYGLETLASYEWLGEIDYYIKRWSAYTHYFHFTKGIVDTRALIYFLLIIFLTLSGSVLYLKGRKTFTKCLYLLLASISLYTLSEFFFIRFDFTNEGRYSLTKGSLKILQDLQKPIDIDVYLQEPLPAAFKELKNETFYLLEEFHIRNPNVVYHKKNPYKKTVRAIEKARFTSLSYSYGKKGEYKELLVFPWAIIKTPEKSLALNLLSNEKRKIT